MPNLRFEAQSTLNLTKSTLNRVIYLVRFNVDCAQDVDVAFDSTSILQELSSIVLRHVDFAHDSRSILRVSTSIVLQDVDFASKMISMLLEFTWIISCRRGLWIVQAIQGRFCGNQRRGSGFSTQIGGRFSQIQRRLSCADVDFARDSTSILQELTSIVLRGRGFRTRFQVNFASINVDCVSKTSIWHPVRPRFFYN